jgi:hypothetical protein
MAGETYRRDFRATAQLAKRVIRQLATDATGTERRLDFIAQRISEATAARPQLVYRTQATGEYRWMGAAGKGAARVPAKQIVGTYTMGADWRDIREDLTA